MGGWKKGEIAVRNFILFFGTLALCFGLVSGVMELRADPNDMVEVGDLKVSDIAFSIDGVPDYSGMMLESGQKGLVISMTQKLSRFPVLSLQKRPMCVGFIDPSLVTVDGWNFKAQIPTRFCDKSIPVSGYPATFSAVGHRMAFGPKTDLHGWRSYEEVVAHTPKYLMEASDYSTDGASLSRMVGCRESVVVNIYFGSWCPFCSAVMHKTIRTVYDLQQMGANQISFHFYGVKHTPKWWEDRELVAHNIRKLIGGAVYINGQRVGVLQGNDFLTPEVSFARYVH